MSKYSSQVSTVEFTCVYDSIMASGELQSSCCGTTLNDVTEWSTGLSKKMDGIWNPYNLKSTGRIYTFGVLKCSEKFKVLDLP